MNASLNLMAYLFFLIKNVHDFYFHLIYMFVHIIWNKIYKSHDLLIDTSLTVQLESVT